MRDEQSERGAQFYKFSLTKSSLLSLDHEPGPDNVDGVGGGAGSEAGQQARSQIAASALWNDGSPAI